MKLSYNWLKDYVKIKESYEKIAEGLTMSGSEVGAIEEYQNDKIMELEITSNRPDCLNMIGLAREVSVVFEKELLLPDMKLSGAIKTKQPSIVCVIKSKKLCPLYTGRIIENINVKESFGKIGDKIFSIGLRKVNNVVDITNFCLMEIGQPLHAFDLDKIKGNTIIIREAEKNEKIITIDDVERELEPGMLVIADDGGPIAVAGVMGGKRTEVTGKTKNILLESAYFEPISVRRTARKLTLSTDSSYRFERGVDKDMVIPSANRAVSLIIKESGGEITELIQAGAIDYDKVPINFRIKMAEKVLGIALDPKRVEKILKSLGMTVETKDGAIRVTPPGFREDIRSEVDVIEEVARIIGYSNIPAKFERFVPQIERKEKSRKVDEKIRNLITSLGFQEIMTYSLVNEKGAGIFPEINKPQVSLKNPLSEQHQVLTSNLIDGMLKSISWNINRKNNNLSLFEIGKAYYVQKEKRPYNEDALLCFALTGTVRKSWHEKDRDADFYDLKGCIEALFDGLKMETYFFDKKIKGVLNSSAINIGKEMKEVGFAGEISGKILKGYGITQKVFLCQITIQEIIEKFILEKKYTQIPKFPFSSRDISVLCDETLQAGKILKSVNSVKNKIIRDVRINDIYKGEQIDSGKKSVMISISYGQEDRTLTEEEIEAAHNTIKTTLSSALGVSFR